MNASMPPDLESALAAAVSDCWRFSGQSPGRSAASSRVGTETAGDRGRIFGARRGVRVRTSRSFDSTRRGPANRRSHRLCSNGRSAAHPRRRGLDAAWPNWPRAVSPVDFTRRAIRPTAAAISRREHVISRPTAASPVERRYSCRQGDFLAQRLGGQKLRVRRTKAEQIPTLALIALLADVPVIVVILLNRKQRTADGL